MLLCNICKSKDFQDFGAVPRTNALCLGCGSLERHRAMYHVLQEKGLISGYKRCLQRCLHLAPERSLFGCLLEVYGAGYLAVDANPNRYCDYVKCVRMHLPECFMQFPDDYFSLIVHNHVLEHIPGLYVQHIHEFHRILTDDGCMLFTIPDAHVLNKKRHTLELGEALGSDELRTQVHGQHDHYKTFGGDFVKYLREVFPRVELLMDPREDTQLTRKHNAKGFVFYCAKQ